MTRQVPDAAQGLVQLSGLVQAAFARVADRLELTPAQARLLCVLAEGPRGMADLARGFGVEKAALTGLVDRAERRGLAERVRVDGDRRAVRVALTESGRQSARAFHSEVTHELRELVAPLAPEDRVRFQTALAVIADAAGPAGLWGLGQAC
ncbi:MarR family transcriptional regulator [Sinomonas sp. ASV322]|uniref:MarR family winged helix-turn-helix transcriptional regulator n=1 Tax=Sinomonas sp. ASV322 TaxID=3041920 RepID=UPI0027DE7BBF|nr:MarR family transcriptional regulator [Sinomonas sp. ASV322]MDQ4501262.1 MarR family transcriptional regulator [Sinomonas sp. ASV322]